MIDKYTEARDLVHKYLNKNSVNEFLTDGPRHGANYYTQEYLDRMYTLSDKYKNVQWLPLDIPKIEINYEEFIEIWDKQCHDVVRVRSDVAEPWTKEEHPLGPLSSWNIPTFSGLHLYHTDLLSIDHNSFASKMYTGKIPMFERLVDQVFTYFPMHTVISIFIWESQRLVYPHRDRSDYWKCPTEFRVMLHDENPESTLFVADTQTREPVFIDLPEDTNSFCWSNGKMVHGSVYKGKRKFILCLAGIQHSKKSDELFERSLNKYKDQLNYKL